MVTAVSVREHEVRILIGTLCPPLLHDLDLFTPSSVSAQRSSAIRRADIMESRYARNLAAEDPSPAVHAEEDHPVVRDPNLLKLGE